MNHPSKTPSADTGSARGALTGVRVIDLSRVLAGPLCTQMLADHGADVIKVEAPAGDDTRRLGPPFVSDGSAAYYNAVNRGKRAIALDLSQEEGQAVLHRLLEDADVLIENFLPSAVDRFGLDYERDLQRRYPRLIYCRISGFGDDGPLGGLPGYDAVLQAMCGLMSVNGDASSGPTRIGVPIVDHLTGYTAITGILMALYERERSGLGQRVEATLFDTALSLLVPHAANWMYSGQAPQLAGSAHPNIAPYDKFMCNDGEVFLGILNDAQFRRFCCCIGRDDLLDDARFKNNAQRLSNRESLRQEIEASLRPLKKAALCQLLMDKGVPAGPVNSIPEALQQAHSMHRQMVVEQGQYRGLGPNIGLSRTPGRPGNAPPTFGENTESVLKDGGFNAAQIAELRSSGAVPLERQP